MSSNWCFTINNPLPSDEESLRSSIPNLCIYVVFGREVGESGTPHLQGYLELASRKRRSTLIAGLCLSSGHFEVRKGTQAQAVAYCKKDGNYVELGIPTASVVKSGQPKNKLLSFLPLLKSEGLVGLSRDPNCTLHLLKFAEKYQEYNDSPRCRSSPLKVIWLYGSTGVGKSRCVFDYCERNSVDLFVRSGSSKWFNGYEGQRFVLFDDFRDSQFEFSFLLTLLDVYPVRVEVKGSVRQWKPDVVFITCPFPPKEAYKNLQSSYGGYDKHQQLMRRLSFVEEVTKYDEFFIDKILNPIPTPPRSLFPLPPPLPPTPSQSDSPRSPPRCRARVLSPTQMWSLVSSDSE